MSKARDVDDFDESLRRQRQHEGKTSMRARDIKPCAGCGRHPLHTEDGRQLTFYVVTVDRAVLDPQAARSTLGLAMHFGPAGGALADVFSPDPHVVKTHEELRTILHVCESCANGLHRPKPLGLLIEAENERQQAAEHG